MDILPLPKTPAPQHWLETENSQETIDKLQLVAAVLLITSDDQRLCMDSGGSKGKSADTMFDPVSKCLGDLQSNKHCSFMIPDEGLGGKISTLTQQSGS